MKEDKQVEKQFWKVENRLEADYADLRSEVKELKERQRQDNLLLGRFITSD